MERTADRKGSYQHCWPTH